jgi:hypothetical protein
VVINKKPTGIWDDIRDEQYVDEERRLSEEFSSEWEANAYLEQH